METSKIAHVVTDILFGDSGKGSITDSICRQYNSSLCIRHSGGHQAAHAVVTDDGRSHVFQQFGSGTFIPGCKTLLSKYMIVHPQYLLNEETYLRHEGVEDALSRMFIDERALVTTPYHIAVNRALENSRGKNRHSSCGRGIGETVLDSINRPNDALRVGDFFSGIVSLSDSIAQTHLEMTKRAAEIGISNEYDDATRNIDIQDLAFEYIDFAQQVTVLSPDNVNDLISRSHNPVFEGAQGVLLDQDFGFHPYTTWSKTTTHNANEILKDAGWTGSVKRIGVCRTYATRHGNGPFVTEDKELGNILKDSTNGTGEFQGRFWVGYLDIAALEYAVRCCKDLDCLAISHCDKLDLKKEWPVCFEYLSENGQRFKLIEPMDNLAWQEKLITRPLMDSITPEYHSIGADKIVSAISSNLNLPVFIKSFGPAHSDKVYT